MLDTQPCLAPSLRLAPRTHRSTGESSSTRPRLFSWHMMHSFRSPSILRSSGIGGSSVRRTDHGRQDADDRRMKVFGVHSLNSRACPKNKSLRDTYSAVRLRRPIEAKASAYSAGSDWPGDDADLAPRFQARSTSVICECDWPSIIVNDKFRVVLVSFIA